MLAGIKSVNHDFAITVDLVQLRNGARCEQTSIPQPEVQFANSWVSRIVKDPYLPKPGALRWSGWKTQDFSNEYMEASWVVNGYSLKAVDFEGHVAIMLSQPAANICDVPAPGFEATLPLVFNKLFRIPPGAMPYTAYTHHSLHNRRLKAGYISVKEPFVGALRKEAWAESVQFIATDDFLIFRFSRPFFEDRVSTSGNLVKRKRSRFDRGGN